MASQRSYARSKSRISEGRLQELMKEYIGEPTDDCMKEEPGKVKGEPVVQAELCQVKQELAPIKAEQSGSRCLTSPARILQLYQVQDPWASETPSKKVKVEKVKVDIKVDIHVWIYAYGCVDIYV